MLQKFRQKRIKKDEQYIKSESSFMVTGGTDFNSPAIEVPDNKLSNSFNCYVKNNRIVKRFGYKKFGNGLPLPNPVIWFDQFYKYDGTEYLCCFTTKDIYVFNTSTLYWDLKTPNVLLTDCETVWTTTDFDIAATAATDWFRYGTKSAKIAISANYTSSPFAYFDITLSNISTYTYIHFYVKSSISLAAGKLHLLLGVDSGCTGYTSVNEDLALPALTANTPVEVELILANPLSDTAILSVSLDFVADGTESININGSNFWIDDIRAVKCYSSSLTNKWRTDMIYDSDASEVKFIATNKVDVVQFWNGSGNWANLPGAVGSPNKAKLVKNYYQYLVLMNEVVGGSAAPQRIEWCVEGRPTHWTDSGSGNNSLAQAADFIVGAEFLQSNIVILKERSIAMMGFTGLSAPFSFDELRVVDVGLSATDSVQPLGTSLMFLGWDNFYLFDGFNCEPPKSSLDIKEKFFDLLNPSALESIHSHIIEGYDMCLFFVPKTGSSYPNSTWCYDYQEDRFYYWEFTAPITASGYYQSISKTTIGQLTMKIGAMNFKIGTRQLTDIAPLDIFGDYNGYTYQADFSDSNDDGVAVRSYFDTKSYLSLDKFSRTVELDLYGFGTDVYVQFSTDDGTTWSQPQTVTLNKDYSLPEFLRKIDITSEKIMMRIGNDTLSGRYEIEGWTRRYVGKERVVK